MTLETWQALTAVGTLALAIAAFATLIAPGVRRWWTRPRLSVRVGDREPWLHPLPNHAAGGSVLAIEVLNKGRGPAREAYVFVSRWWWWLPTGRSGYWRQVYAGLLPLSWGLLRPGAPDPVWRTDIPPRSSYFAVVADNRWASPNTGVRVAPHVAEDRVLPVARVNSTDKLCIELIVGADNVSPATWCLCFDCSSPWIKNATATRGNCPDREVAATGTIDAIIKLSEELQAERAAKHKLRG